MKRLLGCALLAGMTLSAQTIQSTLLALKDSRKALSNQLVDEMMAMVNVHQSPSRAAVERFSEDLTTALVGREMTAIRAAALEKAISDVLGGKGSTFVPATSLRETLAGLGIDRWTVQAIVRRFIEIGEQVRGPDDVPVRKKLR